MPPSPSNRRSSSRAKKPPAKLYSLAYSVAPWFQHYRDIGHSRWAKCTKRILNASPRDIDNLPASMLADAIDASSAYTPKSRQERALVAYTQALVSRGIHPNDQTRFGRSAVAGAAYYGYTQLLELLLNQGNCSVSKGHPHALLAAVSNGQHESMRIMLRYRKEELLPILKQEEWNYSRKTFVRGTKSDNTLRTALQHNDATALRLLRECANIQVSDRCFWLNLRKLPELVQTIYPNTNVYAWSKSLHWTFPMGDRHNLNWMRYHVVPHSTFPLEVWMHVFAFIGRGWWADSSRTDRKSRLDVNKWNMIEYE